jgi:hypothetical protein
MGAQSSHSPLPSDSIQWYRSPIDPKLSRQVHEVSDLKASAALHWHGPPWLPLCASLA